MNLRESSDFNGREGIPFMQSDYIIEMLNIRKEFPGIVANDDITLQLRRGEIHALLGENGEIGRASCRERVYVLV